MSSPVTLASSHGVQHAAAATHPAAAGEVDRPPFAARNGEHGVDLVQRRWWRAEPAPDRPPGQRVGQCDEVAPPRLALAGPGGTRERVEEVGLGSQHVGLAGEQGRQVAAGASFQQREHLVTDPVAPEGHVVVRRVLPRHEPAAGAFCAHVGPPRAEERPHDAASAGWHARQPGRATPAQEVEQDRLGLVIGGVRHEHRRRAVRHAGRLERVVSRRARPRLDVGSRGDGHAACIEARAQPRCRVGHDACLALAPGTQAVIDVHRDRRQPVVDREGQERERVGAARASDDDRRGHVVRHVELHRRRHQRAPQGAAAGPDGPARASRSTPWRSNARSSLVPFSPSFRPMRRRLA